MVLIYCNLGITPFWLVVTLNIILFIGIMSRIAPAQALMTSLDAKGVAVTIDAAHQCMTMRGIKKENATTVTNYFLGEFKKDLSIQNRYLRFISK